MRIYWLVSLLVAFVTGCSYQYEYGNKIDTENADKIKIGKTTKNEVVSLLGPPDTQNVGSPYLQSPGANNQEIWTYSYIKSDANTKGQPFIPFAGMFVGGSTVDAKQTRVEIGFSKDVVDNCVITTMHNKSENTPMGSIKQTGNQSRQRKCGSESTIP